MVGEPVSAVGVKRRAPAIGGRWRRRTATAALLLVGLLVVAPEAVAQRVEARVEPARVTIGETAELVVEVVGGGLRMDVAEPELPPLPDLDVVGTSRSSEVRLVGTDVTRRTTFRYTLRPRGGGALRIDPIRVRVDGTEHVTAPTRLLVVDGADLGPLEEPGAGSPPAVFAVTRVDRRSVWTGEQLTLTFAFYHDPRVPLGESPDYDPPDTPGFWRVELDDQPDVAVERIGGRTYHVQRFRYALFPLREGELTIGPATVRVVEPDADRWWTPGRSRAIETEPLRVTVRPLPGGAPPGYDGAVGRFRLTGSVERRRAPAGTPLELELVVEGTGNPTAVPPPALPPWPEVDVDAPSVDATTDIDGATVGGRTTFRFLVTPSRSGTLDLGSARLAYFDPARGQYSVDSLHLGEILVEAGPALAAADDGREEGPTLWEARSPRAPGPRGWLDSPWYWIALTAPWAGWMLALGAGRMRGTSTASADSGPGVGRRLADARRALAQQRPGAAADAARAVADVVEARWGAAVASADPHRLRAELETRGVAPELVDAVTEARRATTAAAYAGSSAADPAAAIERLESALGSGDERRGRRWWIPTLLLLSGVATAALASQPASFEERWEAANRAYREGDFATAAAVYGELSSLRADPWLEADRAAALWRRGEEGAAVAAYLGALELAPRAWRVRADLADLRAGLGDPPGLDGRAPAFLEYVRLDEWLAGLLALSWIAFGTALVVRRRPAARATLPVLVGAFTVVAALAAVDAATEIDVRAVARSETPIRARPGGAAIASLPEGAVAEVLERAPRAWRVQTEGLPAGWVASDRIVPLH